LTAVDLGGWFDRASEEEREGVLQMVWEILGQTGAQPPVRCRQPGIEAHLLEKGASLYLILINHNPVATEVRVGLQGQGRLFWSAGVDVVRLEKIPLLTDRTGREGRMTVPANAARIYKVGG
jgi:hypothetical protein